MYRGTEIPVEKVGEAPCSSDASRVGTDTFWRSVAGDFYVQRERWNADAGPDQPSGYATAVERITPEEAAAWLAQQKGGAL